MAFPVTPDYSGPDSSNSRMDDINNIREEMWPTLIAGLLNAGFLVPGWNMSVDPVLEFQSADSPTRDAIVYPMTYRNSKTGVLIHVRPHFYLDTGEIYRTRIQIDRKLGDGYEDWTDTTNTKAWFTHNQSTWVVETIDWNVA